MKKVALVSMAISCSLLFVGPATALTTTAKAGQIDQAKSASAGSPKEPPSETAQFKSPIVAAGLSLGTPVAIYGLDRSTGFSQLLPINNVGIGLSLAGFGAGHFYAGEPVQGALFSIGGPLLLWGTSSLLYAAQISRSRSLIQDDAIMVNSHSGLLLLIAALYGGITALHAYHLVERKNMEAPPTPPDIN